MTLNKLPNCQPGSRQRCRSNAGSTAAARTPSTLWTRAPARLSSCSMATHLVLPVAQGDRPAGRQRGAGHRARPGWAGAERQAARRQAHTLAFHAEQIEGCLRALELERVTIAGQDWGGPVLGWWLPEPRDGARGGVCQHRLAAPRRAGTLSWFHRLANMPVISDLPLPLAQLSDPHPADGAGRPQQHRPDGEEAYRYPLRRIGDRTAPLPWRGWCPPAWNTPRWSRCAGWRRGPAHFPGRCVWCGAWPTRSWGAG